MAQPDPKDIESFVGLSAFRDWLEDHHGTTEVLWLRLFKKGSGVDSVGKQEAIDEALCWGWVDGQLAKGDDRSFLIRFTPRKPGSKWSKINTERVARLSDEARMKPAGIKQVAAAKADGRWDAAYAGQRDMEMPADLMTAITASPEAAAFFNHLNRQNRFALYYRVTSAKKPDTRQRRIEQFVAMLEAGETLYPNGNAT